MSNDVVAMPVPLGVTPPTFTRSTRDRWFFSSMAVVAAVTVFCGFAPTYYLKPENGSSLSPLVHLHGAVFTAWMVLFVVQAALIAGKRVVLHRRLGIAGAVLAHCGRLCCERTDQYPTGYQGLGVRRKE